MVIDKMINQIFNEDCLEGMKRIPSGSIDMILCDLPYGTTQNKWDSVIPLEKLWFEYERVIKDNGVIALTASQPFTSSLVMSNHKMYKHEWIWIKNRGSNFANTVREPMKEHESVLIFSKSKWKYNKQMQERTGGGASRVSYKLDNRTAESTNYNGFNKSNNNQGKLRVPSSWQKFNTEVGLHPTQKPVALFAYLIKTYTNDGETVLDNCIGSGTTAIAALETGRNYIGFEKDETYYKLCINRIVEYNRKLKLF